MMLTSLAVRRDRYWWLVLPILAGAFGLRLYHLSVQSLWIDELVTAHYVYTIHMNPALIEPYSLMYVWFVAPSALLIHSEFGLRFPFVLASTISAALTYQIGKQYHSLRAGWIALLLFTPLPIAIYFAQEARLYGIVIASALVTLWCIPLAERGVRWARFVYPISLAFTAAVHLMTLPWLLTQVGVLAVRQFYTGKGIGWRAIGVAFFAAIGGEAAIILIGLARNFIVGSGAEWISVPDLPNATVSFLLNGFGMAVHDVTDKAFYAFFVLAVIMCVLIIVELIKFARRTNLVRRGHWQDGWAMVLLALLAILPNIAGVIVSFLITPVWTLRYFMPSMISLGLLTAVMLASMPVRVLRIGLVAALLACSLIVLRGYYADPRYGREDWRSAISFVEKNATPEDYLMPYRPSYSMASAFYSQNTNLHWADQLPSPDQPEFEPHLREALSSHSRVWIITRTTETEVDSEGWLISPTLDAFARRVAIHRFMRIHVFEYESLSAD